MKGGGGVWAEDNGWDRGFFFAETKPRTGIGPVCWGRGGALGWARGMVAQGATISALPEGTRELPGDLVDVCGQGQSVGSKVGLLGSITPEHSFNLAEDVVRPELENPLRRCDH